MNGRLYAIVGEGSSAHLEEIQPRAILEQHNAEIAKMRQDYAEICSNMSIPEISRSGRERPCSPYGG